MSLTRNLLKSISLAAVVITGAILTSGSGLAAPGGDSARGRVDTGSLTVVFRAASSATGFNASGDFRLTNRGTDPDQVYTGEVTCLRVIAATATTPATAVIGGVITSAPAGASVSSFLITASDPGKFSTSPDTFGFFLSSAPPPPDGGCATPSFMSPVSDGEIIIENAIP